VGKAGRGVTIFDVMAFRLCPRGPTVQISTADSVGKGGMLADAKLKRLGRLCPPYEFVNLSGFRDFHAR
jgi:hypothetical protein